MNAINKEGQDQTRLRWLDVVWTPCLHFVRSVKAPKVMPRSTQLGDNITNSAMKFLL